MAYDKEFYDISNDRFSLDVNICKYRFYLQKLVKLNPDYTKKTNPWYNIGKLLFAESLKASAFLIGEKTLK